jgi:tetratricopeptide (TPR) repeat protein
MIEELTDLGRKQLASGDLPEAVGNLDRALFIGRSIGVDTTELHEFVSTAREQLSAFRSRIRYEEYVDSAQSKLESNDHLAARYFANLALSEFPASARAVVLLEQADEKIGRSSTRESLIQERLYAADSVLADGQLEKALSIIRALGEFAPEHTGVRLTLTRLEIERWRRVAYSAFSRGRYETALDALDSVSALFPDCPWCRDLPRQIEQAMGDEEDMAAEVDEVRVQLSPQQEQRVANTYKDAQEAFERGELQEAIEEWEAVEQLAPNYLSVRKYLVAAYKFVGVELYGQKRREEALAVWRKAVQLDPDNGEIKEYIDRTQNEIDNLRELSYDR